jgi:hypothetical protein
LHNEVVSVQSKQVAALVYVRAHGFYEKHRNVYLSLSPFMILRFADYFLQEVPGWKRLKAQS